MEKAKIASIEASLSELEEELLILQRDINNELENESLRLTNHQLGSRHNQLDDIQHALKQTVSLKEYLERL